MTLAGVPRLSSLEQVEALFTTLEKVTPVVRCASAHRMIHNAASRLLAERPPMLDTHLSRLNTLQRHVNVRAKLTETEVNPGLEDLVNELIAIYKSGDFETRPATTFTEPWHRKQAHRAKRATPARR